MQILETKRLILREMTADDFHALHAVLADRESMRHYPYAFDDERVALWIEKNIDRYHVFGFGLWAVVRKENGEVIGDCGLAMQRINGQIMPEIGYHIRRDCQRQGFASEAARACRDWAFENTLFHEIYSYIKATNFASCATAAAIGMQQVSEYEDEENGRMKVYSITRARWEALKHEERDGRQTLL